MLECVQLNHTVYQLIISLAAFKLEPMREGRMRFLSRCALFSRLSSHACAQKLLPNDGIRLERSFIFSMGVQFLLVGWAFLSIFLLSRGKHIPCLPRMHNSTQRSPYVRLIQTPFLQYPHCLFLLVSRYAIGSRSCGLCPTLSAFLAVVLPSTAGAEAVGLSFMDFKVCLEAPHSCAMCPTLSGRQRSLAVFASYFQHDFSSSASSPAREGAEYSRGIGRYGLAEFFVRRNFR